MHIAAMGKRLKDGYAILVEKLNLEKTTKMIGFDWWPEYLFFDGQGNGSREIQSLFQQEVVRRGILTRAGMMISVSHTSDDIDRTLQVFEQALIVVAEAVRQGRVLDWLDGEIIEPVIRSK